MISTVSFSFDLTSAVPRCVVTDLTDYSALPIILADQQAKGYGVLTFNGDIVQEFNLPTAPLIDLAAGDTVGYINLPVDNNGNVANGVYSFQYSLRLDSVSYAGLGTATGTTWSSNAAGFGWLNDFLEPGDSVTLTQYFPAGPSTNTTVSSTSIVGADVNVVVANSVAAGNYILLINDVVHPQYSVTYSYAGCTQTTADVDFIYDCEYQDFGTWSVSNATVLGSNEIVNSLLCIINYPSWTTSDPAFNPQVTTTVLPYPTLPGDNTPLATGTYSVSLTEQIQQTQSSGLVVIYNKSVIKEFAVSCAGTLCGLVPCIENLRAAHAAELIRNRISKYQVFVDNVALYYIEAMNYRSCGEFDRYRDTINLLQAQLDASGCDCACCDDNSYYWVSNNSANSVIEELLANFQYRLFDGGIVDPGPTQPGVQYGAIWQNTNTGILYRCIDATPGSLEWILYYDPNETVQAIDVTATATAPLTATNVQGQLNEIATNAIFGATNGLTESGDNVKLGGALTELTTINRGANDLNINGTTSSVSINGSNDSASLSVVSQTNKGLSVQGTHDDGSANLITLDLGVSTTPSPTLSLNAISFGPGNGFGSSLVFKANEPSGTYLGAMSTIKSTWQNAAAQSSKLELTTALSGAESTQFTILSNGDVFLDKYGDGNKIDTPAYALGVMTSGKIVESEVPIFSLIVLRVTQSASNVTIVKEIINTTKNSVTGSNTGTDGVFRLAHPDITADNTSVLVQNGNPGGSVKVGFVYAEAGTGLINFKTYGDATSGVLADAILNNAIVEIKIFP